MHLQERAVRANAPFEEADSYEMPGERRRIRMIVTAVVGSDWGTPRFTAATSRRARLALAAIVQRHGMMRRKFIQTQSSGETWTSYCGRWSHFNLIAIATPTKHFRLPKVVWTRDGNVVDKPSRLRCGRAR